jgi:cellulase
MDVWEANSRSNQIAPHTCGKESLFTCSGDECGSTAAGVCDKIGCGDNPYLHRNDKSYYGPGLKVDTSKPFTVVTQFPAKDGVLQAIVRKYVQNGVVIENTSVNVTMDQEFCDAQSGASQFNALGGNGRCACSWYGTCLLYLVGRKRLHELARCWQRRTLQCH